MKVLFVCTGNICRSPSAHAVFEHLVVQDGLGNRIAVDSAGTHAYHVGEPPDARSQETAAQRGIDMSDQVARKVRHEDFTEFDLLVAMDRGHHRHLLSMAPPEQIGKVLLFMDYVDGAKGTDVPDPYYGGPQGFEQVLDLIEEGSRTLLAQIKARLGD